jgi:tripartite motif-containing protein 71
LKSLIFVILTSQLVWSQIQVTELGRFGETGSGAGAFNNPSAIDISNDGRLFICDRGNHRIQVFDRRGVFLRNFGGFGSGEDMFDEPLDVWARSTINIYIADYNNQRIKRYNKDLIYLSSKYSNPGDDERFQYERVLSIAYSPQGDMFILDESDYKVIKINPQNKGEVAFGYYESGIGELTTPVQLELSSNHRVVVSDAGAKAIYVYDYFGNFLFTLEHDQMQYPGGIAFDDDDRLYVADAEAAAIFIFSPERELVGVISEIGGLPLKRPKDMALFRMNDQYNLYILDGDRLVIASLRYGMAKE